jgi:hypothetical protein
MRLTMSVAALGLLGSCVSPALHAGVLSGPIVNPANNHSYYLLSPDSWTMSEAEAKTLGGDLATIRSTAENNWVFDTFSGGQRNLWIGLNDGDFTGTYRWVEGEPFTYSNWDVAAGQPNLGPERWVFIVKGNLGFGETARDWHDVVDNPAPLYPWVGSVYGVVEKVPEPSTLILAALAGLTLLACRKRCSVQSRA